MGFCLADGDTRVLDMSSSERPGAHALELLMYVHILTLPMIGASTLTLTLTLSLTRTLAFVLTLAHIRTCTFAEALTRHLTLMFTRTKTLTLTEHGACTAQHPDHCWCEAQETYAG